MSNHVRRFLALAALVLGLAGCAPVTNALGVTHDARPALNAADMGYFTAKDTDPADAARVAAANARAAELAAEAGKIDDLQRRIDELAKNAGQSGTPIGGTLATGLGILGFLLTVGKTVYRSVKGQPGAAELAALAGDASAAPAGPAPAKPAA